MQNLRRIASLRESKHCKSFNFFKEQNLLRYVTAIGEFNAMIYIPPIRAGKVGTMRKIWERVERISIALSALRAP